MRRYSSYMDMAPIYYREIIIAKLTINISWSEARMSLRNLRSYRIGQVLGCRFWRCLRRAFCWMSRSFLWCFFSWFWPCPRWRDCHCWRYHLSKKESTRSWADACIVTFQVLTLWGAEGNASYVADFRGEIFALLIHFDLSVLSWSRYSFFDLALCLAWQFRT